MHINTERDYKILDARSESIANAINTHIIDDKNTILLLCVTGDIAFSGKEEQYMNASIIFSEIIDNIKKRHNNVYICLIVVPGNHDCNFDKANSVRDTILRNKNLNLADESIIKTCTSVQENFFSFVEEEWDEDVAPIFGASNKSIFSINGLNYKGVSLKFHCINTAWCSTKNEKPQELQFYAPPIEDDEQNNSNSIVITLMHHDEAWLHWESANLWKKYYKHYSDIILVGHDHVSEFVLKENYGASTNHFIKGNQLYSTSAPNQSGFNILKIDLGSKIERFFSYEWNGHLYENIVDTTARPFKKKRFISSGRELTPEMTNYLDDNEIDLMSKHKGLLKLSDIFVYPVLKEESSSKHKAIYKSKDVLIDVILKKKYIIISGEKEYGKTALLKQLFKEFISMKLYPVMVRAKDINTGDGEELNKLIAGFYKKEYINIKEDVILQMESKQKICIIDDFDEMVVSDKIIKKVLNYLTCKFGSIIITSNYQNDMLNFFKNVETKEYLDDNFTKLNIQETKKYMKRELVSRWLMLSNEDQDRDSQEFDSLRRIKMDQVNNVMKTNFFNKTPIEFLLVLSYLDNYEKMNTDYSRHSYIYECLILDQINEVAEGDTNEATMYKTILEQLAYKIYDECHG